MHIAFALPSPDLTGGAGGTAYTSGMVPALRGLGHQVDVLQGPAPRFPAGATLVIDGMLLPLLSGRVDELAAAGAVALIHHVSAAAGRDAGARNEVRAVEGQMLPRLRLVLATSRPVAGRLEEAFGLASVPVIEPGAADLPRNPGNAGATCQVLSAGVLTPRKGHDRLLRALARLTDLDWHLTIAGGSTQDRVHAAGLPGLIETLGLSARVTLLADPDASSLERAWRQADLFALATSWEGYAAGVAEALRRGIPVVVTQGGDSAALVTQQCGAACAADDAATLGKTLRRVIFGRDLRASMAEGAWSAGQALPGWPQQARALETLLRS